MTANEVVKDAVTAMTTPAVEAAAEAAGKASGSGGYVVLVLAVAAVLIAAAFLKKYYGALKPVSTLLDHQVAADTLTAAQLWKWANEAKKDMGPGMQMVVMKTTTSWMTKLGYRPERKLDANHNIVACIIDTVNSDVKNIQLFSFGELDEKIQSFFGTKDIFYLEE